VTFFVSNELPREVSIRLLVFLGVFAAMALWEIGAPRRARTIGRAARWPSNLGVTILNTVLVRMLIPLGAVAAALDAERHRFGLLNSLDMPFWLAVVAGVVLLDFAIYLQHVMFHALPLLWRVHRMHHADLDLDVTSGARFHPIEILLSMLIKLGVVAALGTPPLAVLIFEVLLNATSMFNHSNVAMPVSVDRLLRLFVVTPDMHRVHHSVVARETNSNFGFNLPWWDRWFGTYRAQPAAGQLGMTIGIDQFRDPRELALTRMLIQPFREGVGKYPIGTAS
jgi:sterol desaturase/sphingolipid hydroxylase (fatty acid hydroxylase superfamily)